MDNIVSKKWLLARLYEPDIVIVDCRFNLANPEQGQQEYTVERIPGAIYFHLEYDMSGPVLTHGGRHPLPDMQHFVFQLQKAGIRADSRIIAYDNQAGAMASRFWWLMKYVGHEHVGILEEPFSTWKMDGYPIDTGNPSIRIPCTYEVKQPLVHAISIEELKASMTNHSVCLLDSREYNRYIGCEEPIDRIAGRIPGALHAFWKDGMDEHGKWKSVNEQKNRFTHLSMEEEIIVYCGSGVTACPNIVALHLAGFEKVKLYAGSWSDWISYSENPIQSDKQKNTLS